MLGQRDKELPGTFSIGIQAEACILHNGVNSIKNRYTLRSYLHCEHKQKPSLDVKLSLNLHCGYSLAGSLCKFAQRGKRKTLSTVWWMDQAHGTWGMVCLCCGLYSMICNQVSQGILSWVRPHVTWQWHWKFVSNPKLTSPFRQGGTYLLVSYPNMHLRLRGAKSGSLLGLPGAWRL